MSGEDGESQIAFYRSPPTWGLPSLSAACIHVQVRPSSPGLHSDYMLSIASTPPPPRRGVHNVKNSAKSLYRHIYSLRASSTLSRTALRSAYRPQARRAGLCLQLSLFDMQPPRSFDKHRPLAASLLISTPKMSQGTAQTPCSASGAEFCRNLRSVGGTSPQRRP